MKKYIDEVIAEFEKKYGKVELYFHSDGGYYYPYGGEIKIWLSRTLTEQERRIKEDIAVKIENTRTYVKQERKAQLELVGHTHSMQPCFTCSFGDGHFAGRLKSLNEIQSLLTPLPSSTEE